MKDPFISKIYLQWSLILGLRGGRGRVKRIDHSVISSSVRCCLRPIFHEAFSTFHKSAMVVIRRDGMYSPWKVALRRDKPTHLSIHKEIDSPFSVVLGVINAQIFQLYNVSRQTPQRIKLGLPWMIIKRNGTIFHLWISSLLRDHESPLLSKSPNPLCKEALMFFTSDQSDPSLPLSMGAFTVNPFREWKPFLSFAVIPQEISEMVFQ